MHLFVDDYGQFSQFVDNACKLSGPKTGGNIADR
jgi:hypothetical protein